MFNPALASKQIKSDFIDYLTTSFQTCDDGYNKQFKSLLENEISKGPYVDINDIFKAGKSLDDLIQEGIVSPLFRKLEAGKPSGYEIEVPLQRPLFKHQETALRKVVSGKNIVVTTGTGSGKTESFLYPILNALFREQEKGLLSNDGVRVILIYPMNALANDQIKRIREILMFYPEITFGVFTGDTERNTKSAINKYRETHISEKYRELQNGLPNERFSREQMYENPPHILITNYVMLEYLLLRPDYSGVFNNADLKFIALDESHVYRGATGMETSMLLRKLRARLSKAQEGVRYILTSATLGEKGKSELRIANFASQLTDEPFDSESIIFGERQDPNLDDEKQNFIPLQIWNDLANNDDESKIASIFSKYSLIYDPSILPEENTYRLCHDSRLYYDLRHTYTEPIEVAAIAKKLGISVDDTVAFLFVCSKASRNGQPLLDIHYHFFVRALEGAYATLCGNKQLFLDRISYITNPDGSQDRVFELARCTTCGDIAIIGKRMVSPTDNEEYLVMQNSPFEKGSSELNDPQYFHLVRMENEDNEFVDFGETEEEGEDRIGDDLGDDAGEKKKAKSKQRGFWLCPHCGRITAGEVGKPKCGHPESDMLKLIEIDGQDKCLFCSEGNYSGFYVGSDGATSVLGMSLFESLPTKKCKIRDGGMVKTFDGGKQFLCFSDSRSEAAFFACYESRIYDVFIARRGLVRYLDTIKPEILSHKVGYVTIIDLAKGLAKFFEAHHSFSNTLTDEGGTMESATVANNYAWMIVLDQLVGYNRKHYLQPMGFFQYVYLGITDSMIDDIQKKHSSTLPRERIRDFLSILAMTFARSGAIIHDNLGLEEFYTQYVFRSTVQNAIIEQKSQGTGVHNTSWIPQNLPGKSDQWRRSNRQDIVKRVFGLNGQQANQFLKYVWENYFANPQHPHHAIPTGGYGGYAMPLDAFGVIVPGHPEAHWYRCDNCGRIFNYNIDGNCQVKNCKGHLHEVHDPTAYYADDYYHHVYHGTYLRKLLIKEHTAQLGRQKGSSYQDEFTNNIINALSCSTTFEMGVNLGHLETVFLRDMPPTAANYIQRAGRAGRSKEASAYAITYAKLSSHDFNYFSDPPQMISGKIEPPLLKEDNRKIVYRHIFSVVLGYFFRQPGNSVYFDGSADKGSAGAFLDKDNGKSGYDQLVDLIKSRPADLTDLLKNSFGPNLEAAYNISNYGDGMPSGESWVDVLIGPSGRLSGAATIFEQTLADFTKEMMEIMKAAMTEGRMPTQKETAIMSAISRKSDFFKLRTLIDFFVEANVLPKYGFPIDTVELKQSSSKTELSLSRDMTQAISEYAPGCKVIADGRMYTPRYVAKAVRAGKIGFDDGYYCECGNMDCKAPNFIYDDSPSQKCIGCGSTLAGINKIKAIQPSAGMIAESETEDVPAKKPKRLYHSHAAYVGRFTEDAKKKFTVNGKTITIISTENDRIMVNTPPEHPFYVCQKCGYAVGRYDIVRKLVGSAFKRDTKETKKLQAGQAPSIQCVHRSSNGNSCDCSTLEKRLFVHTFNTDIIQILFDGEIFDLENTALGPQTITGVSVLYALLFAVSKVLDIEQNDIDGCLIQNTSSENTNFRFVIYDNVPGGAGHVKRIAQNNGACLEKVLRIAIEKMHCKCDSACYYCLKTYQNQYYHPVLSHEKALSFLEKYQGIIVPAASASTASTIKIQLASGGLNAVDCNQALLASKAFLSDAAYAYLQTILPSNPPDLHHINAGIKGSTAHALLSWPGKKVMLLRKIDGSYYSASKGKTDWELFLPDDNFDIAAFKAALNK